MDEDELPIESEEFVDEDDELEDQAEGDEEEEPEDEGEKDDIDETPIPPDGVEVEADAIDFEADLEDETGDKKENVVVNKINEKDSNHRTIKIIPADERTTSEIIQWPEMVEAIGIRTSQIEQGAPVWTDVTGLTSPIEQAKKEFVDRESPLILVRTIKKDADEHLVEEWKVSEMTFPITTREISKITEKQVIALLPKKEAIFTSSKPTPASAKKKPKKK
jgi:hypothetical protein